MKADEYYKIGYILKPHGLKGEVTVALDQEFPETLDGITAFFLEAGHQMLPYFLTDISIRGNKAFVKFEDVDTQDAAAAISKKGIFLPKSLRPKSARGEFYDDEVVGFVVEDQTLGELGEVLRVETAGLNRLIVVNHNKKEVLIPVNSPLLKGVNKTKRKITVVLPEGFLEI